MLPYSVASALALLSQAANGNTLAELRNGLQLRDEKLNVADQYFGFYDSLRKGAGKATLEIANQLFVNQDYKLNKTFQDVAVEKFMSGIESLDFSKSTKTAETVNRFVEEKTHDRIKNLISPNFLNKDTRAVLINAVYMKAKWLHEFDIILDFQTRFSH